ncbi:MAG: baseplate J/gp47 family protein [Candidatus Woesebacteria bacterium]|nr:MAG: baseplate J/gp47 family protein [Candidatus Woesebacteria bacterium]
MNLKDFLNVRDKPPELFWSVVLEPGWVQAGIWYVEAGSANMVNIGPGAAWEVDDELVGAADAALSSTVQKLPENYPEPTKTVFGVPSAWVKSGEIVEEHLAKIKKICADLSLNPAGFVVINEAIAHFYKSEEGSPVNAIIVGLGNSYLELSVFKLGNLVGSTSVARSVSLIEDITEGLSRFDQAAPLPSRFIIFDGKGGELEEAKETILQASWIEEDKIKFLHAPKVETLSSDRKILATSLAGASEIGQVSQIKSEIETEQPTQEEIREESNVAPPEEGLTPEALGFSIGQDVTVSAPSEVVSQPPPVKEPPSPAPISHVAPERRGMSEYIKKTKSLFRKPPILPGRFAMVSGVFLVIFLLVLGLGWWFFPKAHVVIYVTPKTFQEESEITLNTGGSDSGTNSVPAAKISVQVSGEKTKATSGFKLIGDKAKGTVQIANGNSSPIDLAAGTILLSSGGLKFVTNSEASVSSQLLPGSPGTAMVDVTAGDIGSQYNLPKGEVFKVGNFSKSLVAGTSTGDFSGGSSQQIAAVSKDDQNALETQLKDELTAKGKVELSTKVTDNQILIDAFSGVDTITENYDHKVGDAADSLKLSLLLSLSTVAVDKQKLLEYARNNLKDKVPSGFVLRDSQIDFKFTFVSQKDDNYVYKVAIGANFLPQVNTDAIAKQISGRSISVSESYLTSTPGFSRADITLNPRFPGPFGVIPRVLKNIKIEVVADK